MYWPFYFPGETWEAIPSTNIREADLFTISQNIGLSHFKFRKLAFQGFLFVVEYMLLEKRKNNTEFIIIVDLKMCIFSDLYWLYCTFMLTGV